MITYVKGDVTEPVEKPAIIAHVVNDVGLFGAGVAAAIAKKYPQARDQYLRWFQNFDLNQGDIRFCLVDGKESYQTQSVWICHMVSQVGVISAENTQPFKIESLDICLGMLSHRISCVRNVGPFIPSVHMPRVGMGLGGWKDWTAIENLIEKHLASFEVFVYDFEPGNPS